MSFLKSKFVSLMIVLLLIGSFSTGVVMATDTSSDSNNQNESTNESSAHPTVYPGVVKEIVSDQTMNLSTDGSQYNQRIQVSNILILKGPYKGKVVEVSNYMDSKVAYNIEIEVGDEVYCMINDDAESGKLTGNIFDYRRDKYLFVLAIGFVIFMLIIGGLKGLKSLVTLAITFVGVYYMMIGIIQGANPIFLSIAICMIATVVNMFLVAGFNSKAVSAIFGTIVGTLIAGVLALIVGSLANVTGLGNSEAQMLLYSNTNIHFDINGILFASILLGTLGAVMDVAMSIASAINEVSVANPLYSTMDLFKSGMNIGKDVMGTMANTLILAYAGSSMFLLLVFMQNNVPYIDIINMDMIATEVMRALTGTMGIIAAMPATAIIASILEKKLVSREE